MSQAIGSNFVDTSFEDRTQRAAHRWLLFLCACLLGYSLAGRGFAYVGYPPIYIGEICLLVGLLTWASTRGWMQITQVGATIAVLPLFVLGVLRLIVDIPRYQIDAARDAVIFGYAIFALIVASLIVSDPRRLQWLIEAYRKFSKIFLIGILGCFFLYRFMHDALPIWPWAKVQVVHVKEGDALVHLAGILAFWMGDRRRISWFWIGMLTIDIAAMGVVDRAGLLAFLAVLFICLLVRPSHTITWKAASLIVVGVFFLWATNFNLPIPGGKGRSVSFDSFSGSVMSMMGIKSQTTGTYQSTTEWRLDWWREIYDYTFNGPYFWTGKGFGPNLATEDGFQVMSDNSLRSPHSIHMNVLARMGVPGIVLWVAMHFVWLFSMAEHYMRARRRQQARWAGLMLFLFCYYLAFMINGSFDVFIEGPMGGIWFWTIYGTGVGAMWVWRNYPELLADSSGVDESTRRAQLLSAAGWRRPGVPVGAGAA